MVFRIHYWNNRDPVELSSPSTVMCAVTAELHTFLFNPFISKYTNLREIISLVWDRRFVNVLFSSLNSEAVLTIRNILPLVEFNF